MRNDVDFEQEDEHLAIDKQGSWRWSCNATRQVLITLIAIVVDSFSYEEIKYAQIRNFDLSQFMTLFMKNTEKPHAKCLKK